ncbi:MAG: gliding motility protein GldL [Dysgonomonas sp.]
MGKKYRKYKNTIEKYLASEKGRRFFHVAYSIGASIVIIGALFKINHYPLGTEILMIGMITEALIFALSAFDTPSKDYKWEEVYPVLANDTISDDADSDTSQQTVSPNIKGAGGSTVIIGGGSGAKGFSDAGLSSLSPSSGGASVIGGGVIGGAVSVQDNAELNEASEKYAEQLNKATENMEKFAEATNSLAQMSDILLNSFKNVNSNSEGLGNNTQGYIVQMEALNRNLAGLNTIYEIQLKGVSGQIHTIEQINAGLDRIKRLYDGSLVDSSIFKNETEKMAHQLSELNRVYARMLQAMTVNMNMNIGGFGAGTNFNPNPSNPQDDNK